MWMLCCCSWCCQHYCTTILIRITSYESACVVSDHSWREKHELIVLILLLSLLYDCIILIMYYCTLYQCCWFWLYISLYIVLYEYSYCTIVQLDQKGVLCSSFILMNYKYIGMHCMNTCCLVSMVKIESCCFIGTKTIQKVVVPSFSLFCWGA